MAYQGIDVSVWNGKIDWQQVAAAGKRFAMVRAGFGRSDGTLTEDDRFRENITGASNAGIFCGSYLYSYAQSVAAAQKQAENLAAFLEPYREKLRFPVAFDMEEPAQTALGKQTLTAMANIFCSVMRSAGFRPMIYANPNWLRNYLIPEAITGEIWLAQWAAVPTWTGKYALWQYSSVGRVAGISGNVDLDVSETLFAEEPLSSAEAIDRLTEVGFLNRPDYWREAAEGKITASPENIGALLVKTAAILP